MTSCSRAHCCPLSAKVVTETMTSCSHAHCCPLSAKVVTETMTSCSHAHCCPLSVKVVTETMTSCSSVSEDPISTSFYAHIFLPFHIRQSLELASSRHVNFTIYSCRMFICWLGWAPGVIFCALMSYSV